MLFLPVVLNITFLQEKNGFSGKNIFGKTNPILKKPKPIAGEGF
jgi:hypothetical protein